MRVRDWWNQASEKDQDAVLANLKEPRGWAGCPWAFLPEELQEVMTRRLRINPAALKQPGQRPSIGEARED